jgi:DNA-binding NarL/FixJ family response regulator
MDESLRVNVVAADPMLEAGASTALQRPGVTVVGAGEPAEVTVVVIERLDDDALEPVRTMRAGAHPAEVVIVAADVEPAAARQAIAAGARGLLHRSRATGQRLVRTVFAAARGDCTVTPDLLGPMLDGAADGTPPEKPLDDRERAVLHLIAEGHETSEVASALAYSTRTVTTVVQRITSRFGLRNRAHAVAFAMRSGLL